MDPQAILRAFSELASSTGPTNLSVVTRERDFVWLASGGTSIFDPPDGSGVDMPEDPKITQGLDHLAAIDRLHKEERLLRAGWVFLCGRPTIDQKVRRVFLPLLSVPITIVRNAKFLNDKPVPRSVGDREMLNLVDDIELRSQLEEQAEFSGGERLDGWIRMVATAAGFEVNKILSASKLGPARAGNQVVAVVGTGVYVARDVDRPGLDTTLRNWAALGGIGRTAFAELYRQSPEDGGDAHPEPNTESDVASPLPLNRKQRRIVQQSRINPISVMSGPPGTGKSHAVVATALDAVAAGRTVLIATRAEAATTVIADLIEDHDGPTPILFGGGDRRQQVATTLSDGVTEMVPAADVRFAADLASEARKRFEQARATIANQLAGELELAEALGRQETLALLLAPAPGFRTQQPNLGKAKVLLERARSEGGFLGDIRRRRADAQLRRLAKTTADVSLEDLGIALTAARQNEALRRADATGGLSLAGSWAGLALLEQESRSELAHALSLEHRSRIGASAAHTKAAAALAAALRSGRGVRRRLLRDMEGPALVRAMPLWVGTLADIDDILPAIPGLFDLVILDEASQIDQPMAATALLRASNCVIVGDPRQLRHVSFTSDAAIRSELERHGLADSGHAGRMLDIRRVSAFDLAASAAPVTMLDEHFRCVPHLIEFSLGRFYNNNVGLMTRHPINEQADAIDVTVVEGLRTEGNVNPPEVEVVMAAIHQLIANGERSVGVLTPFRAQADAIEEAILSSLDLAQIDRLDLRAGTVHSFQGWERDIVILSTVLTPSDPPNRQRFLEDPHLFNVMVSRARKRVIVVTSMTAETADGALLKAYLQHADQPPSRVETEEPNRAWPRSLYDALTVAGIPTRANYPVGAWTIDLVIGEGANATGIICAVHPAGPATHIERELSLRATGWSLVDAFPSRVLGREAEVAAELAAGLAPVSDVYNRTAP